MNYSQKIYELRKKEDISQEALAALIGTTRQQVSRWECGVAIPNPKFAYAIASHFGITVEELFGEKVEEEPGDAKEVLSFRFKNISLVFSFVSLINFCAMVLLGYFSDKIAQNLYLTGAVMRDAGVEYDFGTFNGAVYNISRSICLYGIAWTSFASLLICSLSIVLFARFSKITKNRIIRSNLFSSITISLVMIISTAVASILSLSIGKHVIYIKTNTLGFFDGLLFLFGAIFIADVIVTLIRIVIQKIYRKFMISTPWKGFRKIYEIIYLLMGFPLFVLFVILGKNSYIDFMVVGLLYFPLALILLLIHIFACYKPFGSKISYV